MVKCFSTADLRPRACKAAARLLLAACVCSCSAPRLERVPSGTQPRTTVAAPQPSATGGSFATTERAPAGARTQDEPPPLPEEPAARLAELQRRLGVVTDFDDEEVPPAARPLLVDLRQASIAFLSAAVDEIARANGGSLADVGDAAVEAAIESRARAAGVEIWPRGVTSGANGLWSPSVTRSKVNPRYVVIGFYFRVPCGNDGGYLVYDLASSQLVLSMAAPDGETIEPMFHDLSFALPPPGDAGRFVFALTRITPWCQSAQRRMQLLVLEPTEDPAAPRVLINVTTSQHLQRPYGVEVGASTITLHSDDGITQAKRRWRLEKGRAIEFP